MHDHGTTTEGIRTDEVTALLLECEATLRSLQEQRRLTAEALGAFVDLASRIRSEMERRRLGDRRHTPRSTPERRAQVGAAEHVYRSGTAVKVPR